MRGAVLVSLALHVLPGALAAESRKCYFSNHNLAGNDVPCDPNAEESACCSKADGSICLENGLCQNAAGHRSRGSCTDRNWDSKWCPQFCLDNNKNDGVGLRSCSSQTKKDTSFCCWYSDNKCCESGVDRFELLPSKPGVWATYDNSSQSYEIVTNRTVVLPPVSSSVEPSTSTTSTSTSASSSTATSQAATTTTATTSGAQATPTSDASESGSASGGLSTGSKAGIGVGVALGVLALLALGFFLRRWYEGRHRGQDMVHELDDDRSHPHSPGKYSELAAASSWNGGGHDHGHGHGHHMQQQSSPPYSHAQTLSHSHSVASHTHSHSTPHTSPVYENKYYPPAPYQAPVEMPARPAAVEMPAH